MQLSIIIVNYNVKYFLEHCLHSVIKACAFINAEILVVDNNSTDGSEEYLSPKFPDVQFYWNKTNPGFAKANNSLLSVAKGEYILFLNPDTILPEDCFTKCIHFFDMHKECGALGVKMIDGSGIFLRESKRGLPTASAGFFKMSRLIKFFPSSKIFARYYAGHLPDDKNNITEVLAGAYMMLSKKAVQITKGFDEDFFMYGEDVDLSYRISQSGMHNYYFANTVIIHFKGESTQKKSATYNKYFYEAMKRFVAKHYSSTSPKYYFMQWGISFGKCLALLKQKCASATKYRAAFLSAHVIVYGTAADKTAVKKIINKNDSVAVTIQNINNVITGDDLAATIKKYKAASVIFCEGLLSYKEIIIQLQILPHSCNAFFFFTNAQSIICSGNKNANGLAIAVLK